MKITVDIVIGCSSSSGEFFETKELCPAVVCCMLCAQACSATEGADDERYHNVARPRRMLDLGDEMAMAAI